MAKLLSWQKKIIKRLELIFKQTMEQQQTMAAIQCLKTMATLQSLFEKNITTANNEISLTNFSDDDLKKLIEEGEKKLNK